MYIQELLNYRMYLFRHIKRPYPSCRPLHLPKVPDNVCLQNSQPPIRKNIILIKFRSKQFLVIRFNALAQSEHLGLILPTKKVRKISGIQTKFCFFRKFFPIFQIVLLLNSRNFFQKSGQGLVISTTNYQRRDLKYQTC